MLNVQIKEGDVDRRPIYFTVLPSDFKRFQVLPGNFHVFIFDASSSVRIIWGSQMLPEIEALHSWRDWLSRYS